MKNVLKIAIKAINVKFGLSIDVEDKSDEIVAELEEVFQNIYDTLYKKSEA